MIIKRYLARMRLNGVKTHPFLLSGMNEWGGLLILIATGSTSYKNIAAKRALRSYYKLSCSDGRVQVGSQTQVSCSPSFRKKVHIFASWTP